MNVKANCIKDAEPQRRTGRFFAQLLLVGCCQLSCGYAEIADAAARGPTLHLDDLARVTEICVPTQVGVFGEVVTVMLKQKGLFFRRGDAPWRKVPLALKGPHSVARLPNGEWLINDTDNDRLIEVRRLSDARGAIIATKLGGFELKRPHDQIVDPKTGEIYIVDGNRRLFRFLRLNGPVEVWTFTPDQLGYDRALSWLDGHLHIIDSSRGEVMRIDDYAGHRFTVFRSPRPANAVGRTSQVDAANRRSDFDAGALTATGLVLNDVQQAGGWYYGTNFFTPNYASGHDTAPGRLIRWRSWADFQDGKWEDLSGLLPASPVPLTPYFLTIQGSTLYTGLFDHDEPYFGPTDPSHPCRYDRLFSLDLRRLPLSQPDVAK